ncbi:MAG: DUF3791 domain-containing protein [Clostridiales bacterium]|nr:DUF3791 domain-containing protein [Clostridiales bacterium]
MFGGADPVDQDTMAFVIYMIHRCANKWKDSPAQTYKILKEAGCIENYLVPHYDVLHTQSSDYVVNDIEKYIQRRGAGA